MSKSCRVGHDIIETGDPEAQLNKAMGRWPAICDSNGEVVLAQCRKCGRGEVQLEEPCVSLQWVTPNADKHIAYLARVSNTKATPDQPSAKLISYLLRNHHWSPFEMASMCIEINTTRDITNQIIRHRSFAFQEFSTRYADVEVLETWRECRFQDEKNRQNSFTAEEVDGLTRTRSINEDVRWWEARIAELSATSSELYSEARRRGIAKEVARAVLPFGLLPSKIYMAGTIRSWLHYIGERTKPGVQKEHREMAVACGELLRANLPDTWAAYEAVTHNADKHL